MIIILLRAKFGSLPWRSRSQHDLAAKLCPAHNFVIWSRILKLFHRNDPHIETLCRMQHLGGYLEGQGHSMTLQQNHVQPITFYLKSDLKTISQKWLPYWDMCCVQILGCYLEGQGHRITLQQNYFFVSNTYSRSITRFYQLLFYDVWSTNEQSIGQ